MKLLIYPRLNAEPLNVREIFWRRPKCKSVQDVDRLFFRAPVARWNCNHRSWRYRWASGGSNSRIRGATEANGKSGNHQPMRGSCSVGCHRRSKHSAEHRVTRPTLLTHPEHPLGTQRMPRIRRCIGFVNNFAQRSGEFTSVAWGLNKRYVRLTPLRGDTACLSIRRPRFWWSMTISRT